MHPIIHQETLTATKCGLAVLLLALAIPVRAAAYKIALITDANNNLFWETVYSGAAKARDDLKAEGIDIALTWDGPDSDTQREVQIQLVEQKVKEKVDGIVLSPLHGRLLSAPVAAATKAGIPTVVINAGLNPAGQISFVATDNYKGGALGARRMGTVLKGKGKVILFRWLAGNAATTARETGFLDTLKSQFPEIQVISADQYAQGSYDLGKKTAVELLQRLGREADGIFTVSEITTVAMLDALRATDQSGGKAVFIGYDSNPQLIAALKAGDIKGLVIQNPMQMGYQSVRTLVSHLQGKIVEKEIDTGCTMVTTDNMAKPAVDELLNPRLVKYAK
ncbi:MAG TPA: substrate-binding domain-containing protein [Opitutaceae bacterium]|nr:substrate-binding domain-containing protein [Opitutaceae bacterium]